MRNNSSSAYQPRLDSLTKTANIGPTAIAKMPAAAHTEIAQIRARESQTFSRLPIAESEGFKSAKCLRHYMGS